jgi:hypothetical protein
MSGIATAIAVTAGATLYAGNKAADAAGNAADIQAQGAQAGIEEQRRQFDVTQGNLQPFQQAGVSALEQQRILLGLGGTPEQDPNLDRRADLQSQIAALEAQGGAQTTAPSNISTPGFNETSLERNQRQSRMRRSGGGAVNQAVSAFENNRAGERAGDLQRLRSELSGIPDFNPSQVSAQEQQQQAFAAFNESPGQKFMRDRAQKNLLRNSSAIGGLGGGNVRSALVEQGVGFAQQDYNNQFARLGQIAGQGQAATTNLGQFGAQSAGNIANLNVAGSEARASGILGGAQARSNTVNQIAGLGGLALGAFNQPQTQFNPGSFFGGS